GAVAFFCFAKRKSPKKRRAAGPAPAGCLALLVSNGVWLNSLRSDNASPDPSAPALLSRARTAGERNTGYRTPQGRAMARPCCICVGCSGCPLCRNEEASSAEPGGSGAQMFEPEGRVSAHPAWIEQRSVPAQPGDESGSPSLCLLSLGEARESEAPAGARPGHRPLQRPTPQLPWIPGQAGNDNQLATSPVADCACPARTGSQNHQEPKPSTA